MQFAKRIAHLQPEGAFAVLARARALEAQGREIVHLEVGEPDFDTPDNIALAGIRGIATGMTHYSPPSGTLELKAVMAEDAGRRRGTQFAPEQVVIAPGCKPLIMLPMWALLEPGDEVILPDPAFPSYEAAIRTVGAVPKRVPLVEEEGFELDLDAFDAQIGPQTRMIVLNSPGNPGGNVLSLQPLEHIADAAERHDCWVLSDEIYFRLVYGMDAPPSIASLPGMQERTVLADGFSKTYAMTGWRLGYGIMPVPLAEKMNLLLTHTTGCTATFTQLAGVEAITGPQDEAEAVRAEFQRRRDLVVDGLNAIPGISCTLPRGAFYAFPNVEKLERPCEELADYLLEEAGVSLLPGTAFGPSGEGHLRISYANSSENILKALDWMEKALDAIR
jgi:aspartate/methionine/tyrosine aminotransferase